MSGTAQPEPALPADRVRELALATGFPQAAVLALPHAAEARDEARFNQFIAEGRHGGMRYLARADESGNLLRARVQTPFPWARSVVLCSASYHSDAPRSIDPAPPHTAWIARYAWSGRRDDRGLPVPSDYHRVLKRRLTALDAALQAEFGPFESRAFVDTGPLVERSLAAAAGLGWIGKNTCLISQRDGSYTFLACLVTALPAAETRAQLAENRCGSCRRCLDACPTGALVAPGQMDARRCISYLTIEHRGPIAPELMEGMGRQIFGCDICQDVCPWNRKAPVAADPDLAPRPELVNPSLDWLGALSEADFERLFNSSPIRRPGFAGFARNLAIAMGSSAQTQHLRRLAGWAGSPDEGLRRAALWAFKKLSGDEG